jgi:chaperone BCS1
MISQSNADIVVFEDIDCAFPPRDQETDTSAAKTNATSTESSDASSLSKTTKKSGKLTFSGFLNCFDGIQSSEGNIVIFTTNHLNKIDEALLRPGRVDRIFEIPLASRNQIYRMVSRFFPDQPDVSREYSEQCPERELSMATIQGHLLCHRHDAAAALSSLPQFLLDQKKPKVDPTPVEPVQSTIVPITAVSSDDPVPVLNKLD